MSIPKLTATIITLIITITVSYGQLRAVDSLKKILPSLHDSSRVDCLNDISETYIGLPDWFAAKPGMAEMDSAEKFTTQSLSEAKQINYLYGMSKAMSLKADLAFEKYENYKETESLSQQAISLYEKSTNKKGLNKSYWRLGTALHSRNLDSALISYETSYKMSIESGDSLYAFYSTLTAAAVSGEKGDFTKAFEELMIFHQLINVGTALQWKAQEFFLYGDMYLAFEDYTTALKFYQQGYKLTGTNFQLLATIFALNKQPDSAKKYFNYIVADTSDLRSLRFYLAFLGEYRMLLNEYDKALPYLLRSLSYNKQAGDFNQIMLLLINIAKTNTGLQKNDSAFKYAQEAFALADKKNAKQVSRDASKILSGIYEGRHRYDSAFYYYKLYKSINDSILNDHLKGKLAGFSYEQKIELLNKEKEIQQVRLQKESLQKKIIIAGAIIFLLIAFLLWRNNRHKQKAYLLLQNQKQETDIQKTKAEEALQELKTTQTQLIHSEKMASLGELTAGIAHEIQNPLNFVNNFSDVNTELIEELKSEWSKVNGEKPSGLAGELFIDIAENEKKINHHGKRADGIVKGMLQHSRSNSGIKEPADINTLADEYLRIAYQGFRAKDNYFSAILQTDFDPSIGKFYVIPQDIGRVLLNLYNNAFYAINEKKKTAGKEYEPVIAVNTKKIGDKIQITVNDNGNGIPQKVADKIFQPFFTTKPTGQGTGLGLSLAYDIVKAHGGEIKVNSVEGEQTTFIVTLPVNV